MAVFTIARLTVTEAIRRRTLVATLVMGLFVLGLSFLLILIRRSMDHNLATGRWDVQRYALMYPTAISTVTTLCLGSIKWLSVFFALMLAGAAISGEIERGLLAVILPKPIGRWQILLGKWLGLNLVLVGSVLFWVIVAWASLSLQTLNGLTPILRAGLISTIYPVLACTLALTFSTFSQRTLGTSLALAVCAVAWMDGILSAIADQVHSPLTRTIARIAGLLAPQGYVGWWVDEPLRGLNVFDSGVRAPWASPRYLNEWGLSHLNTTHLDVMYVIVYVMALLAVGVAIFQRRDI